MLDTSSRLLGLLALLQTHRDRSASELADRLGITSRTVRRDVERLRTLGYPVDSRLGPLGGYRLGRGTTLPPLLLDDAEAVAVVVALRAAASVGVAGIDDAALQALAKLEQVLPSRLQHQAGAIGESLSTPPARGPQLDPDVLTAVAAAVRDHQQLRIDYVRHDGSSSRRTVEPYRIVHSGTRWYLLAYDPDRADWRTLRMDRLHPLVPTGPSFLPRPLPEPDAVAYVLRGVHTRPYPHLCEITVAAPAGHVVETFGIHTAQVVEIDAGHCRVSLGSTRLAEVAARLISLDAEFVVHEPAELREHLAAIGRRLTTSAGERGAG